MEKQLINDASTLGMIEGLLEAWTGRGQIVEWQNYEFNTQQLCRLTELFTSISNHFVIYIYENGAPSTIELMKWLAAKV